jgi:hypothetical protein
MIMKLDRRGGWLMTGAQRRRRLAAQFARQREDEALFDRFDLFDGREATASEMIEHPTHKVFRH